MKKRTKLIEYIKDNQNDFYRLAFSYAKNKEDALDIVQNATYKALKNVEKLKNISYLETWVYRIIVNESLNFIKKHKKVVSTSKLEHTIEADIEDAGDKIDVHEAMLNLDEKYKSIIVLRFFKGFKIKKIAKILNLNINTTKSRLYKALDLLKIDLEGDGLYEQKIKRS